MPRNESFFFLRLLSPLSLGESWISRWSTIFCSNKIACILYSYLLKASNISSFSLVGILSSSTSGSGSAWSRRIASLCASELCILADFDVFNFFGVLGDPPVLDDFSFGELLLLLEVPVLLVDSDPTTLLSPASWLIKRCLINNGISTH